MNPFKKTLLILSLLLFLFHGGAASGGWQQAGTEMASSLEVVSLDFFDNTTGWALVERFSGWEVHKTTDGGANWAKVSEGTERVGTGRPGLQFFSASNGWMWLGESFRSPLLRTTDGGLTWSVAETPMVSGSNPEVTLAWFLDDQTGWIAGRGRDDENNTRMLARTTDGGASWQFLESPLLTSLRDMQFKDANNGILAAHGTVLVTNDGGASWFTPPLNPYETFRAVYYDAVSGRAWLGGGGGLVLMSPDDGQTWLETSPQSDGGVRAFLRTASGRFFLGGSALAQGFLHEGTVENTTWRRHNLPSIASGGERIPLPVDSFAERPDGTVFLGSWGGIYYLPPDAEPVLRATGERHPYNRLPSGITGEPWEHQPRVIGGVGPFTWALSNAPGWMSIDPATGLLSGTPGPSPPGGTLSGQFTLTVTDSRGRSDTMPGIRVQVSPSPMAFSPSELPPAVHRRTYHHSLNFSGGNAPYSWRVVEGALPRGMTVEGQGILAGTPHELGVHSFTVEVTDSSGIPQRARAPFTIQVTPLGAPVWEVQHAYNRLTSIHFFDENEGVAGSFNGTLHRTYDGGRTWRVQSLLDMLQGSAVVDLEWQGDTGIMTGRYGVWRSTDRGLTWARVITPQTEPVGNILPFVAWGEGDTVFLLNDRITRSTDGGVTWQGLDVPVMETGGYVGLAMADANRGWAVGWRGPVLRTTDGGATWQVMDIPLLASGLAGGGAEGIEAVGDKIWIGTRIPSSGQGLAYYRSEDDGQTWTQQNILPNTGRLQNIQFLPDGQTGWITGLTTPGILRTTDGGVTWERSRTWSNDAWAAFHHFLDENTGWMVINAIGPTQDNTVVYMQGSIWKTDNGGRDWVMQMGIPLSDSVTTLEDAEFSYQHPSPNFSSVAFASPSRGFAVAQDPFASSQNPARLMRTDNGGATWRTVRSLMVGARILFVSERTGFIYNPTTSTNFTIGYVTRDGGESWLRTNDATADDMFFVDEMHGWRSRNGTIFRTTDAGHTWEAITNQDEGSIGSRNQWLLHFNDRQNGWRIPRNRNMTGILPYIQRTADGGETWTNVPSLPTWPQPVAQMRGIYSRDPNTLWITGTEGTILSTADGGNSWEVVRYEQWEPREDDFESAITEAPTWTGMNFINCAQGFAIGFRRSGQVNSVGFPVVANTSDGSFEGLPERDLGIGGHSIEQLSAPDAENYWAYGALGAGFKFSAATGGLTIVTESLPRGTVNDAYSFTLATRDHLGSRQWTICEGSLPPGMSLTPQGVLTGTPAEAGGFRFNATVTDFSGSTSSRWLTLIIEPRLRPDIITETLPSAETLADYGVPLEAAGSPAPYTWYFAGGEMPPGLQVRQHGAVSGIPTVPGVYEFTVEVRDAQVPPGSRQRSYTLTVGGKTAEPSRLVDIIARLLGLTDISDGLDVNDDGTVDAGDVRTEALDETRR